MTTILGSTAADLLDEIRSRKKPAKEAGTRPVFDSLKKKFDGFKTDDEAGTQINSISLDFLKEKYLGVENKPMGMSTEDIMAETRARAKPTLKEKEDLNAAYGSVGKNKKTGGRFMPRELTVSEMADRDDYYRNINEEATRQIEAETKKPKYKDGDLVVARQDLPQSTYGEDFTEGKAYTLTIDDCQNTTIVGDSGTIISIGFTSIDTFFKKFPNTVKSPYATGDVLTAKSIIGPPFTECKEYLLTVDVDELYGMFEYKLRRDDGKLIKVTREFLDDGFDKAVFVEGVDEYTPTYDELKAGPGTINLSLNYDTGEVAERKVFTLSVESVQKHFADMQEELTERKAVASFDHAMELVE